MLSNRELAILTWSLLFLGAVLASGVEARKSALSILRTLATPKVAVPLALYVAWLFAVVLCARALELWNPGLLKGTIVWTLGSGIALFFGLADAIREPGYFARAAASTLRVAAFVEYAIAFRSFPLVVELVLQPVLFIVAMAQLFAANREGAERVERSATAVLGIALLAMLGWAISGVITGWGEVDGRQELLELLQPVWLTLAALPFVYLASVAAAYEDMFLQARWTSGGRLRWFHRLALIISFGVRLNHVRRDGTPAARSAGRADGLQASIAAIRLARRRAAEARDEAAARERRLVENAGLQGEDADGRQLDRREFRETQAALRWLATCQAGNYRSRGTTYHADLVEVMHLQLSDYGLPSDHGIEVHVSDDGQQWWAGRRTVTGWYLAIGSAGPPYDEWFFDGAEPPPGFPDAGAWDQWVGGQANSVNWQ